jgi:hypothetical protein
LLPEDDEATQQSLADMMLNASLSQRLSRTQVLAMVLPQLYGEEGPPGYEDVECAGSDDEEGSLSEESYQEEGRDEERDIAVAAVPVVTAVVESDLDSAGSPSGDECVLT